MNYLLCYYSDELLGQFEENYEKIDGKLSSFEAKFEKQQFEEKLWTEKMLNLELKIDQLRQ